MDDHDLLEQFVEHQSERAFAELVERHLPFVYATALRLAHDPHTAQDIAQSVFIQLARRAGTVRDGHALPGWLYRATHYAALVVFRREGRRRERETAAMNLAEQNTAADPAWAQISPLLDEALDRLDRADQDAVLLRFFHEKSYREVGEALGVNEDAARKRVDRALEKVRGYFSRRGVTTTAALLGSAITAHAATPPPVALSASLSGTSLTSATATAVGAGQLGWKIFLMSTSAKIITTVIIVAALAAIPLVLQQKKINNLTAQLPPAPIVTPSTSPLPAAPTATPVAMQTPVLPAVKPQVEAPVARTATPAQLAAINQAANNQAIINNLRQISSAAQQYMLDLGLSQCTYYDLVGTSSDNMLHNLAPIAGEDYTGLVFHQTDTQISLVGPDGSVVTFSQ
mgnify:CR=1 FL=1